MYEELTKALRKQAHDLPEKFSRNAENIDLFLKAADAIEELQKDLERTKDFEAFWQKEAEDALRKFQVAISRKPQWIPVTERLPEEDESVFVVRKFLGIKGQVPPSTYTEIAYRIDDNWYADSDEYKIARSKHTDPLYWMPLPEPPESESE